MILLLRQELFKLYRRYTPYLIYAAALLLIGLMCHGMRHDPRAFLPRKNADFEVSGNTHNGLMLCQVVAFTIGTLLLYLQPVVAGEILGGEGAAGTLRTLLVRPRPRWQVWCAKYLCAWFYSASVSAFTMLLSLGLGTLLFGWGKLIIARGLVDHKIIVLTPGEALPYLLLCYAMMTLSAMVACSLAMALASWFDNGLAPGFTALGTLITLQIVGAMEFTWVETIKPYLFTTYMLDYAKVFPTEFDPATGALLFPHAAVGKMLAVFLAYIVVFATVGLWRFVKRDVTC